MAKDTFYFPHDYNARSDPKIKKLIRKYGFVGYGIYWAIVEDLYDNANALPTDYETIAYDFRTDENTITSIIKDFDLFVIEGEEFGSLSIQKRLKARDEKSLKARESARKRWDKVKDNANALPSESEPNAIKERKEKENKRKEGLGEKTPPPPPVKFNFKKSLLDYGLKKQLVDDWMGIRKKKVSTNSLTAYENFITQLEKSCADHSHDKNTVFLLIVQKEWKGFNSSWYTNHLADEAKSNPNAPQQKTSLSTSVSHFLKKSNTP